MKHHAASLRQLSFLFYLALMKFYKICTTYSWVYTQDTTVVPLPSKPVYETFYFNDVLQSWNRDLVECRVKKAGPFDYCCRHQSLASPSLYLYQGSRWTFGLGAHFVVFSWFNVFHLDESGSTIFNRWRFWVLAWPHWQLPVEWLRCIAEENMMIC